jgi:hypothetical protein
MRLVLILAIIVSIACIGWAFYHQFSTARVLKEVQDASTVTKNQVKASVPVVSTLPDDAESNSETESLTFEDDSAAEECCPPASSADPFANPQTTSQNSFVVDGDAKTVLNPEQEANLDELEEFKRLPPFEGMRRMYVKKFGDTPDVRTYVELQKRLANKEPMTAKELLTYLKLGTSFHPDDRERQALYEHLKNRHDMPGATTSISYIYDPPE